MSTRKGGSDLSALLSALSFEASVVTKTALVDDCLSKVKADTRQGWDHQITVLETAAAALKKQKRMADHFRWHYLGEVE